MNNKGFTLVELLAVVLILGAITVIGLVAYQQYIENTKKKAFVTLAESASNAAAEYNMDHPNTQRVTLKELVESQYLENAIDPSDKEKRCKGLVKIVHITGYDGLEVDEYDVSICCSKYQVQYHFPGGAVSTAECGASE